MRAALGDLVARAIETSDAMDRRDAKGWLVVCVDLEPPESLGAAYGPFASPELALVEAAKMDVESKQAQGPDPHGWRHDVVPLF